MGRTRGLLVEGLVDHVKWLVTQVYKGGARLMQAAMLEALPADLTEAHRVIGRVSAPEVPEGLLADLLASSASLTASMPLDELGGHLVQRAFKKGAEDMRSAVQGNLPLDEEKAWQIVSELPVPDMPEDLLAEALPPVGISAMRPMVAAPVPQQLTLEGRIVVGPVGEVGTRSASFTVAGTTLTVREEELRDPGDLNSLQWGEKVQLQALIVPLTVTRAPAVA